MGGLATFPFHSGGLPLALERSAGFINNGGLIIFQGSTNRSLRRHRLYE